MYKIGEITEDHSVFFYTHTHTHTHTHTQRERERKKEQIPAGDTS